ncbi:MAG: recombinase family protein [Lachnospiraceae bacterium]|nr:recombinase family protein [Lachnospiraceae bacterium]
MSRRSYVFGGRIHPLHIASQKTMLKEYAKCNGFLNCQFYIYDGYSGTNYDRPVFQQLIEDIRWRLAIIHNK